MSLIIKDGAGVSQTLKTGDEGGELITYHAISGTVSTIVNNTASITASLENPVGVSGSVDIGIYKYGIGPGLALTVKLTGSTEDSAQNVKNVQNEALFVTSSNAYPVVIKNSVGSSIARTAFSSFAGTIDWAGTGSSDISGTFILAPSSSTRRGLMFANGTDKNLYIALGDTDLGATNGFLLSTTASAPSLYSFILYPSGTYFADPEFVTFKHSGFFISSSNIDVQVNVISTE